jgi:hypothetical protein
MIRKFDFPTIENFACVMFLAASSEIRQIEYKDDALPVDVKLPVKHIITTELQVYTSYGMHYFEVVSYSWININELCFFYSFTTKK